MQTLGVSEWVCFSVLIGFSASLEGSVIEMKPASSWSKTCRGIRKRHKKRLPEAHQYLTITKKAKHMARVNWHMLIIANHQLDMYVYVTEQSNHI